MEIYYILYDAIENRGYNIKIIKHRGNLDIIKINYALRAFNYINKYFCILDKKKMTNYTSSNKEKYNQ